MILYPLNSNHFTLLGLSIHYYSVCIFLGILISLFVALFSIKKLNLPVDKEIFLDFVPLLITVSIIGARLYYVLLSWNYFSNHINEIFMIWQGGISIHGAILAGIIFGIFYFKKKKLPFFRYADIFAFVLPLGQAIGRFGNYFNQEAIGTPILGGVPIMLFVDREFRPQNSLDVFYYHPAFLYESVLDFILFFILLFLIRKTAKKFDGLTFFAYIFLYSLIRLPLEFLRLDTVFYLFNLPFPALVSIFGVLIGVFGIVWCLFNKH